MWRTVRLQNVKKFTKFFKEITRYCTTSAPTTEITGFPDKIETKKKITREKSIELAQKLFGFEYETARYYVSKRAQFQRLDPDTAMRTLNVLETFGVPALDVANAPAILNLSTTIVTNRYQILKEIGFKRIKAQHICQFLVLYQSTINSLKEQSLISSKLNVIENIMKSFKLESIPLNITDETQTARMIREVIMFEYMKLRLNMSESQINTVLRSYYRKLKSANSILEMIRILKKDLKFDDKRIHSNSFILYADPKNVRGILEKYEKIGGVETKVLLYRRPKVMMQDLDTITKTIDVLKEYNISEKSLSICPDVLALQTETVRERLNFLTSSRDFNCIMDNPRVLKLVYNFKKAKERLEHLQHTELKCVFLHLLMGGNETFERYIREGIRNRKGNDFIIFLSNQFNEEAEDVRKYISRHPYWKCTPLSMIKDNLTFLEDHGYKKPNIYKNVYLLLYPTLKLKETLNEVKTCLTYSKASPSQQLSLVLYLMEKVFHFTGDGIWPDLEIQEGHHEDISESRVNPSLLRSLDEVKNLKLDEARLGP